MRKIALFILPIFLVFGMAYAAYNTIYTASGVQFYKDSTWHDTTDVIEAKDFDHIYITTYFANTTTTDYTMKLIGYISGRWQLIKTYTTDSNKTTPIVKTIVHPDTNYLGGINKFRIINSINGGDSSNLLKYYQSVKLFN